MTLPHTYEATVAPVNRQPTDPEKWLTPARIAEAVSRSADNVSALEAQIAALEARVALLEAAPAPSKAKARSTRQRRSEGVSED